MNKTIRAIFALILFAFAPVLLAEPLDINTATVEQIDQAMVGVGKVKAEAIVKDREKNGPFKSVDDLLRVKGIGPATLEKNRAKLTVGTEAPAPQAAPAASPPTTTSGGSSGSGTGK